MFQLIATKKGKADAQKKLVACLKAEWRGRETRRIVWRPSRRDTKIIHNERYWFASLPPDDATNTSRYWVPLGQYIARNSLQIAVELNVPTESNTKLVSAFFARELGTGAVCLFHDGGLGGGRPGVGRDAYLAWSKAKLVPVLYPDGKPRLGILVASLESKTAADDIGRFVQHAIDFKVAVKNGETRTRTAKNAQHTYGDYFKEFSGKKKSSQRAEFEYLSRHGDIVDSLHKWRGRTRQSAQRLVKNAYIDLGVVADKSLIELYEVKTNLDRQTLYAGIGQLIVHDNGATTCGRHLVLPEGDIPDDVLRAVDRHKIGILRFRLSREQVHILT